MKHIFFNLVIVGHLLALAPVAVASPTLNPTLQPQYVGNPILAYDRIGPLVSTVLFIVLFAGIITALIFLLVGAVQYGTAGDGPGAQKGRQTMTYAVVGIILLALVFVFMTIYNNILPKA
jgi:hypothetical protein